MVLIHYWHKVDGLVYIAVSVPLRGLWFLSISVETRGLILVSRCFRPLAGIMVLIVDFSQ